MYKIYKGELSDLVFLLRFRTLSVPFYAMRLSAVTALNISFKRPTVQSFYGI